MSLTPPQYKQMRQYLESGSRIELKDGTPVKFDKFRVNTLYNGEIRYCTASIQVTTNNSSYNEASKNSAGIVQAESSHTYNSCPTQLILDVTDTAQVKVRFTISVSDDSTSTAGHSDYNRTCFSFLRLGDT